MVFEMRPEGIRPTTDISADKGPEVVRQLEALAQQQVHAGRAPIRGCLSFAVLNSRIAHTVTIIDRIFNALVTPPIESRVWVDARVYPHLEAGPACPH